MTSIEPLHELVNPTAGEIACRAMKCLLIQFELLQDRNLLEKTIESAKLGVVDLGYLENENNWISFEAGQRIIDVLDLNSNDPEFLKKAGLRVATKDSLGVAYSVFKSFGTPSTCYEHLFKTLHLYNRVGEFRILKLTNTSLRFAYRSSVVEPNLRFSVFRLHQFASIPMIWGIPPAKVAKLRCQVTEDVPESIYEIKWRRISSVKHMVLGALAGGGGTLPLYAFLDVELLVFFTVLSFVLGGVTGQLLNLRQRLRTQELVVREQTEDLHRSMGEVQVRYDEVQALNVSLEQKVEERTAALTLANERLKELDKHKDQFLANISHELRTPLVALSSTLQMMLQHEKKDALDYEQLLLSSSDAIDDMLENVNDLLLKAQADQRRVDMSWSQIAIDAFLGQALAVFDSIAKKRGVTLKLVNKLDVPVTLCADRAKLKKVINNLVGNAIKFSPQGEVQVSVAQAAGECVISVQDTGIGIPEDELEAVFSPFFQASNNVYRNVNGTGIGLALVKDLVALNHGRVEVASQLGVGSVFKVYLPLGSDYVCEAASVEPVTEELFPVGEVSESALAKEVDLQRFTQQRPCLPHILIVEDNLRIAEVLAYILNDHYNLHFACDGRDGIEKVNTIRPSLIISDIMMPRMDGYEFLANIKNAYELKNIPVILLTSKADRSSRIRGFELGADEYLTKPFNNQEVLVRVAGLIARKQMEAELVQLEKMVALGQLAAGVGHEINNPLAFAKSAADTVEKIYQAMRDGRIAFDEGMIMMLGAIKRIKEGTSRVAEITEALRGFVRQGSHGVDFYDIHQGIESTLKIIHVNHKTEIAFSKNYALTEKVECNINQINQVVMNLLQNACQALSGCECGVVSIQTDKQAQNARIIVRDNGPGIPDALMGRIFEPFFTTKELGKGTGLGLYICKQIIAEHNGSLTLCNHEEGGVECVVLLPLKRDEVGANGRHSYEYIDRYIEKVHYPHRR